MGTISFSRELPLLYLSFLYLTWWWTWREGEIFEGCFSAPKSISPMYTQGGPKVGIQYWFAHLSQCVCVPIEAVVMNFVDSTVYLFWAALCVLNFAIQSESLHFLDMLFCCGLENSDLCCNYYYFIIFNACITHTTWVYILFTTLSGCCILCLAQTPAELLNGTLLLSFELECSVDSKVLSVLRSFTSQAMSLVRKGKFKVHFLIS